MEETTPQLRLLDALHAFATGGQELRAAISAWTDAGRPMDGLSPDADGAAFIPALSITKDLFSWPGGDGTDIAGNMEKFTDVGRGIIERYAPDHLEFFDESKSEMIGMIIQQAEIMGSANPAMPFVIPGGETPEA